MSSALSYPKSFMHAYAQTVKNSFSDYNHALQDVEAELRQAPENTRSRILQREQGQFNKMFDAHLDDLVTHAASPGSAERAYEGRMLREVCKPFICQAPLVHRTNLQPRGYQGDSEMMSMIYANDWQGETLFGKLLHKYAAGAPVGEAVRNRRLLIAKELRQRAAEWSGQSTFNLLSVACGPAQEVADIFQSAPDLRKYCVTLLDQDPQALEEARKNIEKVERDFGTQANVRYEQKSIKSMLRPGKAQPLLPRFDLIYSMGLYDYLDDKTAKALTSNLFQMLAPGGTLLIGNYATTNARDVLQLEYWCDWQLIYRDEQKLLSFVHLPGAEDVSVKLEASGTQMFLHAKKAANNVAQKGRQSHL